LSHLNFFESESFDNVSISSFSDSVSTIARFKVAIVFVTMFFCNVATVLLSTDFVVDRTGFRLSLLPSLDESSSEESTFAGFFCNNKHYCMEIIFIFALTNNSELRISIPYPHKWRVYWHQGGNTVTRGDRGLYVKLQKKVHFTSLVILGAKTFAELFVNDVSVASPFFTKTMVPSSGVSVAIFDFDSSLSASDL